MSRVPVSLIESAGTLAVSNVVNKSNINLERNNIKYCCIGILYAFTTKPVASNVSAAESGDKSIV